MIPFLMQMPVVSPVFIHNRGLPELAYTEQKKYEVLQSYFRLYDYFHTPKQLRDFYVEMEGPKMKSLLHVFAKQLLICYQFYKIFRNAF